jgi:hypothetical protein
MAIIVSLGAATWDVDDSPWQDGFPLSRRLMAGAGKPEYQRMARL